jgi:hypothetical protein
MNRTHWRILGAGLAALLAGRPVLAQDATELAKQTQNPVANLISVPFQGNWDVGLGDRHATGTTLNIQPVAPFGLTRDWNVILRIIMPLVSQPTPDGLRVNGMGDTVATVFLAPKKPGALTWGAGPVLLVPTGTNNTLGTEKFGLGPSIVALAQPGKWTVGALFNQIWSVDGATDRDDVSRMFLQPFVNYNLGEGLAVGVNTEATADWKADDTWTTALLFTGSKVTRLGARPVNFAVGVGPVLGPESGADWKLRLTATFLFPTSTR